MWGPGRATCPTTPATPPAPGRRRPGARRGCSAGRAMNTGQAHRVASFAHPTTQRLSTPALHPQLGVLAAQPGQLSPIIAAQGLSLTSIDRVLLHPVTQGLLPNPQLTGDLGDRLARLPHDLDRSLAELRIEPTSGLCHSAPYSPCLHDLGGTSSPPVRSRRGGGSRVVVGVPDAPLGQRVGTTEVTGCW